MSPRTFLILNLALAFYNLGTIWAHEIDIFRSWTLIDPKDFRTVQRVHWRKLPYWIFAPFGVALIGGVMLIRYHPDNSPRWAIASVIGCQALALVLTAVYWGRWQARLARDPLGSRSPYLTRILRTHWVRTLLISAYAITLLIWVIATLS